MAAAYLSGSDPFYAEVTAYLEDAADPFTKSTQFEFFGTALKAATMAEDMGFTVAMHFILRDGAPEYLKGATTVIYGMAGGYTTFIDTAAFGIHRDRVLRMESVKSFINRNHGVCQIYMVSVADGGEAFPPM